MMSCVTHSQLAKASRELETPPGTIISFAGARVPEGWLLCDGRTLSRRDYPRLFNAIGTHWGGTANDEFRLPDLRKRFLRGADSLQLRLGNYQGDATKMPNSPFVTGVENQKHTHDFQDAHFAENNAGNQHLQGNYGRHDNDNGRITTPQVTGPNKESHTHPITGGDDETRPMNAAVNYIIKI